jgi:hypothetical protein
MYLNSGKKFAHFAFNTEKLRTVIVMGSDCGVLPYVLMFCPL